MIINPYVFAAAGYNPLTQAWIDKTGETDTTILNALNDMEQGFIDDSLSSKIDALYPMVGGNATKHKYNFMDVDSYELTFSGGWTHSSTGALPNASNAYADTSYTPSTDGTSNSHHMSYYSRTDSDGVYVEMGSRINTDFSENWLGVDLAGTYYPLAQCPTAGYGASVANTDSSGYFIANRTASNDTQGWKDGTELKTSTQVSGTLTSIPTYLGARNRAASIDLYSDRECALASIGTGLTDADIGNLDTLVATFQTALSRNV